MANLPPIVRALFPGETAALGYTFFRQREARPLNFIDHPGNFWNNAWWCSQLSLLAYAGEQAVGKTLLPTGLDLLAPVVIKEDLCAFVVATRDRKTIVVAIRGTLLPAPQWPISTADTRDALGNWARNLNVNPIGIGAGQSVHPGMRDAWLKLEPEVSNALTHAPEREMLVWAGHSLGGGVATIASRLSPQPAHCAQLIVSFGSPRAGNAAFARAHPIPHWRFVLGADAVTNVPPADTLGITSSWSYSHHGSKLDLSWDNAFFSDAEAAQLITDQFDFGGPPGLTDIAELALVPHPLRDHAMLLYSAKCEAFATP